MATIVRAEEEERKEKESVEAKPESKIPSEDEAVETPKKEYSDDDEPIRPVKKRGGKKKGRKMTNLDISSEDDDERDEDFKGTRYKKFLTITLNIKKFEVVRVYLK